MRTVVPDRIKLTVEIVNADLTPVNRDEPVLARSNLVDAGDVNVPVHLVCVRHATFPCRQICTDTVESVQFLTPMAVIDRTTLW